MDLGGIAGLIHVIITDSANSAFNGVRGGGLSFTLLFQVSVLYNSLKKGFGDKKQVTKNRMNSDHAVNVLLLLCP